MVIFGVIIIYSIFSIFITLIMADYCPTIEETLFLNILKWKEINLFGKIIFIIISLPIIIAEYIIRVIKYIFTWHPGNKD